MAVGHARRPIRRGLLLSARVESPRASGVEVLAERLHFALLWVLVHVGARLPPRVLYGGAAFAGSVMWYAVPAVRATTRDHARHVLGAHAASPPGRREVDRTARECARGAAMYYADFARYTRISPAEAFAQIESIEGVEAFFAAYDRGCGVVVISAHLGCPEALAQALGCLDICFAGVVEQLPSPRIREFVRRVRGRNGVRHLAADLSGLRAAHAHVKGGGALGVLTDRDVLGSGRTYPFFGEPARLPTGAVDLALRTRAPLLAAWVLRGSSPERTRLRIEVVPLPWPTGDRDADLDAGMRAVIERLEQAIASTPGQWFPLTPIWRGEAAAEQRVAKAGGTRRLQ